MLGRVKQNRTNSFPIGVDLGFDAVRLLQLRARPDGSLAVAAAARHSLWERSDSQDPVARLEAGLAAVAESLRSGQFTGRTIVTALPRQDVHVRSLRIPLASSKDDKAIIEGEAAAALPLSLDAASIGFIHAGEVRHGGGEARREVIAIAAAQQDVDDFLERLHVAGTRRVAALDVQPLALHRSMSRSASGTDGGATMLLDIGAQASEVVIGRSAGVNVIRTINIGGCKLNAAVARRLGISEEDARNLRERLESTDPETNVVTPHSIYSRDPREAVRRNVFDAVRSVVADLAAEVMVCLRYFSVTFRGRPVTRVVLSGGEARFSQISQTLAEVLGVPVDLAPVFKDIEGSPVTSDGEGAEWAIAMGLALRGVNDQAGDSVGSMHAEALHA